MAWRPPGYLLPFQSHSSCRRTLLLLRLALPVSFWLWLRYINSGWLLLQFDIRSSTPDPRPEGVLLVSAYFPYPSAKHSQDEYNAWLGHFLSTISADLYFFTTPEMGDTVRALRGPDLPLVLNTHYKSPFDIEPLKDRRKQVEAMHGMDREQGWHNPNLYAIWAAKPFFVNEALHHVDDLFFRRTQPAHPGFSHLGHRYKYVFWVDCGSFRAPHPIRQWPYIPRVDAVFKEGARKSGTKEEDLVLVPIQWTPPDHTKSWNESMGPIDIDLSEGSFFGGHPEAVRWWYRAYFAYFNHYADKGLFVGKDQTLMNSLLYLFRDRIINVWYNDPAAPERRYKGVLGDCSGWWYYYFFWLATPREQLAQAREWYEGNARCRVARVVSFAGVLRQTFGRDWVGPKATLPLIEDK
ncbi:hypothetical protein EXIGLDRAFT_727272 [Exidia glandulosa HHB12029]|uniref:Uncharacterized protein n=1 Tax=Exidia glandulosa HHB12029 TaxID=1314781 RepID=A0A165ZNL9_EXIGL|nr:hypothetical protein EXIGLDRAFT_727272 [Exidia glandulosa HHB12029]